MKGKIILRILAAIITLWSFYGYFIRKISTIEKENYEIRQEINELKKIRNKKIQEYDKNMDLEKIEQEMNQKNMQILNEINFFKIEKKELEE